MVTLNEYKIVEELYQGEKTVVFRAQYKNDFVIIKYLNHEYPSISEIEHFKREYNILTKYSLQNSIRALNLENDKNTIFIVFEDLKGISLSEILKKQKRFELKEFLNIAIKIVTALAELHANKIVHKDIKPHNIIYNEDTKVLKLIDFGSASLLTKENPEINMRNNLEGTLAYISPEQTGRLNCNVDERTDFYSLGVTLYQLVTGKLPFDFSDPSELVHAHIAVNPVEPSNLQPEIPKILSEIILKLMSKSPDLRYQTMTGLLYDLQECEKREFSFLNAIPVVSDILGKFEICTKDFPNKFKIPEKLYGREKDVNKLFSIFEESKNGSLEVALVRGESGVGKTALVGELQKPIIESKGYYIKGKYDKFKKNIPYRAFIYAFQELIKLLLLEPEEKIVEWKTKIKTALGSNAKILTEVIPELEHLIGEQPDVIELQPQEAQNRFNLVFFEFVKVFCSKSHPLVIFLDDLQWADIASIQLLNTILTGSVSHLFLILSYRINEVDSAHPFYQLITEAKNLGLELSDFDLGPLQLEDVNQLVADTLKIKTEESLELGNVLFQKTNGNPFFLIELFTSFYKNDFIYLEENNWCYKIEKIKSTQISNNVVDLIVNKITNLSNEKIEILKITACIGNWFFLNVLTKITNLEKDKLYESIEFLANEGYYIVGANEVKFIHDKVVESVYSLLTEEERAKNHYKIGKTYLELVDSGQQDLEDRIFTLVNQLNQGISSMDLLEKERLIELNILAGKKALTTSAYDVGFDCYKIIEKIITDKIWTEDYKRAVHIFSMLAKFAYLSKKFDEAEKYFSIVFTNTKNILDRVVVIELKSQMLVSQNRLPESVNLLKGGLKTLGVSLPKNPTDVSPLPEIIKFKIKSIGTPIQSLSTLPKMEEDYKKLTMILLNSSVVPAFISQPKLFPVLVLKMVNLSLKYGNHFLSPFAYAAFGLIQGSGLGDYKKGYEFGKMSLELISIMGQDAKQIECRTIFLFANMINHWISHSKENKEFFLKAIHIGQETGDLPYTSYCINHLNKQGFLIRKNLEQLKEQYEEYFPIIEKLKQHDPTLMFKMNWQICLNLKGDSQNVLLLESESNDTESKLDEWITGKNSTTLFVYYTYKAVLEYFFGELEKAQSFMVDSMNHEGGCFGMMIVPENTFFSSLISAKLYLQETDPKKKKEYEKNIHKNQKRMKVWAENCPANYGHKYLIVEALLLQMKDDTAKAISTFEKAGKLANVHEYLLEEALANELSAEVWLSEGNEKYAKANLVEAHYMYEKWGCKPKVKLLEEKYPYLKRQPAESRLGRSRSLDSTVVMGKTISSGSLATTSSGSSDLDINVVLKASQALASEMKFDSLLRKLLNILFEHAGATEGSLLLADKDKATNRMFFTLEARGAVESEVQVLLHIPLEEANLPESIINFVSRTKQSLVLNDASKESMYIKDSYIKKKLPKSVLCHPIVSQGKVLGIIYLENNLTPNAFTTDRLETLQMLSSQMAISIENAKLLSEIVDVTKEKARVGMAMEIAREIQTCLLPDSPTMEGYEVTAFMQTADEVGGDYYDIIHYGNKDWIVIGDVSGHGIQAGLIMMMVQVALHSSMQYFEDESKDFSKLMQRVNAVISSNIRMMGLDKYMTITVFLRDENVFHHAGAHQDIIVYRKATGTLEYIETPGSWLGMDDLLNEFPISEFRVESGDVFLLYTDGISEGRNGAGEMLGMRGLAKVLEDNAFEPTEVIKEKILNLLNVYKNNDDITFMVVRKV